MRFKAYICCSSHYIMNYSQLHTATFAGTYHIHSQTSQKTSDFKHLLNTSNSYGGIVQLAFSAMLSIDSRPYLVLIELLFIANSLLINIMVFFPYMFAKVSSEVEKTFLTRFIYVKTRIKNSVHFSKMNLLMCLEGELSTGPGCAGQAGWQQTWIHYQKQFFFTYR